MTPLEELRHSAAHVMATAVLRLFPETQLDIGPPTDTGFYYDFDLDHAFTRDDLNRIEAEMIEIVGEDQNFERIEMTRAQAEDRIHAIGQTAYKIGRLADIPEGETISFYRNGEFLDLCAGTHVKSTSAIKALKLLSVAGAYHRGNAANKQLQRIYGTAFPSQTELEDFLKRLEEAQKRDHRRLGRDLRLFHIDEDVGQGLVLWLPAGATIRQEMQTFILELLQAQGYRQVFTPHIGKLGLYRTSGHFPYYRESQFPPMIERDSMRRLANEGCSCAELSNCLENGNMEGFLLRPMNCPHHIKIYESASHSYRDLPIRLAEFGTVYRWEQSGELGGMTRVRGFTQDDAHIFCSEEQLPREIEGCLDLVRTVLQTLGLEQYRVRIGLRDPKDDKYTGQTQAWDKAEEALRQAAGKMGIPFAEELGEAAFYGPKIDFVVKDVIGREWQLGTVQVDYNLPVRFNLSYVGSDNEKHTPVMIHRAPFGSLERFCGVMIEHFNGAFPLWLAPEQTRLVPITDRQIEYCEELAAKLRDNRFRCSIDVSADKMGAKIRKAELEKIPYMLVVGEREMAAKQAAVRARGKGDQGAMLFDAFLEVIREERDKRLLTPLEMSDARLNKKIDKASGETKPKPQAKAKSKPKTPEKKNKRK